MRVAIHQPNFVPWTPFFYKMALVDKFIILTNCQFEKNGFQNRYQTKEGKWVTMPVVKGLEPISEKFYTTGMSLLEHNIQFIEWMANTLGFNLEVVQDCFTNNTGTHRILDNLNCHGATTYVTNPEAKDKYLDEKIIKDAGIKIEYCVPPYDLRLPIWDALATFGIDGLRKRLEKERERILDRAES